MHQEKSGNPEEKEKERERERERERLREGAEEGKL
jgi:hypothetical protein